MKLREPTLQELLFDCVIRWASHCPVLMRLCSEVTVCGTSKKKKKDGVLHTGKYSDDTVCTLSSKSDSKHAEMEAMQIAMSNVVNNTSRE